MLDVASASDDLVGAHHSGAGRYIASHYSVGADDGPRPHCDTTQDAAPRAAKYVVAQDRGLARTVLAAKRHLLHQRHVFA